MANDTFTMSGKLRMPKSKDNYSPYRENTYDSGWMNRSLNLIINTDKGNQFLNMRAMKRVDNTNELTFWDNKEKKSFKIPFKNRNDKENLKKVQNSQKFTIDLEEDPSIRRRMTALVRKIQDKKELTNEELNEVGVSSSKELVQKYKDSYAKRFEYLSLWDFLEKLKEIVESGNYDDTIFKVSGRIEINHYDGTDYFNYVPRFVTIGNKETDEPAQARVQLFFDENAVSYDDVDKQLNIDGFLEYWDSNTSKNQFHKYTVILPFRDEEDPSKLERKKNHYMKLFSVDDSDEVKSIGIVVDLLNGSPTRKVTMDDLSEEQKEAIEFGDKTFEEIVREIGGNIREESIQANIYSKLQQGWSGAKKTSYRPFQLGYVTSDSDNFDELDDELVDIDEDDLPFDL